MKGTWPYVINSFLLDGYIWVVFGKNWNARKDIKKTRLTFRDWTMRFKRRHQANKIIIFFSNFNNFSGLNYDLEFGMTTFLFATTNKIRWVEKLNLMARNICEVWGFEVGFKSYNLIFISDCVNVTLYVLKMLEAIIIVFVYYTFQSSAMIFDWNSKQTIMARNTLSLAHLTHLHYHTYFTTPHLIM